MLLTTSLAFRNVRWPCQNVTSEYPWRTFGKRGNQTHQKALTEQGIQFIDLVVVNLYPFKETILKPAISEAEAIEMIDIGGPSMLRSAAKIIKT